MIINQENSQTIFEVSFENNKIFIDLSNNVNFEEVEDMLNKIYQNTFDIKRLEDNKLQISISENAINELRIAAIKQNTTTLRNRVNELGVAEPIVQQSRKTRIVVELPGVKDTTRAKEIIGATATLEFKMVDEESDAYAAEESEQIMFNSKLYYDDAGQPVLLKRNVILTGENIVDASLTAYLTKQLYDLGKGAFNLSKKLKFI